MNQKEKAADRRLQRTYGITLADYKQMLEDQDGVCAICRKPPKEGGRGLHTDHDHAVSRIKILYGKDQFGHYAYNPSSPRSLNMGVFYGRTKKEAKDQCLFITKHLAVRGLLCWQCNTAIQKFRDDPDKMESAAKYIRKYKESINAK